MRRQLLCLLLFFGPLLSVAQLTPVSQANAPETVQFDHYRQTEGLSQGYINDIVSYDGFMWFATQDGLNRFDGLSFEVFRKGAGTALADNMVQALLADSQGRLWIGTGSGITIYDCRTGQFQPFANAFGLNHLVGKLAIHALFEDKRGRVWMLTNAQGIFCLDLHTRQLRHYFPNNSEVINTALSPTGEFYVSTYTDVYRFDEQTHRFAPLTIQKRFGAVTLIRDMKFDRRDLLWISTTNGAFTFDKQALITPDSGAVRHYRKGSTNTQLTDNDVTNMLCDRAGRMWLGTRNGGICLFDPTTGRFSNVQHQPTNPRSLPEGHITFMYEGAQGIVWVGVGTTGLQAYDPNRFPFGSVQKNSLNRANSLPDNMVLRLQGLGDDLFIGTDRGGFARYSFKTRTITTYPASFLPSATALHNQIYAISADRTGKLWFANWRELTCYDPVRQRAQVYPVANPRQQFAFGTHVLYDAQNKPEEIWVGGHSGLSRFDLRTKQWRDWADNPALRAVSSYNIRLMYQHVPDMIWLGTLRTALIGYNRTTRQTIRFDSTNGLTCPHVRSLLQIGQSLWVGTGCGLYRIDLSTRRVLQHFTTADGLPNDMIYGILPDDGGNLWLSSNAGLTYFSPTQGVLKNYDVSDGLPGNEFNTNVCYKHRDGTLFFGGVAGITYFHPDQFRRNTVIPPVRITGIAVLDSAYNPTQTHLTLGPGQNFVEFSFAALNFSNSRKNRYMYQLVGIDPVWVRAGHRRTANYSKLPPGDYIFRVKGSNDDGLWNEQGASVRITINPPFWATVWFRVMLLALLLTGAYGLYRFRLGQLRQQQQQILTVTMQTQELERQRFAKELHDGIGANLSVLKLYLSALGRPNTSLDDIRARSMAVLETSVSDVRSLVHDMHPRYLHEQGLVGSVADMVRLLTEIQKIRITYKANNVPKNLPEVIEINSFRIVQELLQNAIKHAHASQITLSIRPESGQLRIDYHDNGQGFDLARLNGPTGNGLLNIRQRVDLLNGSCLFTSSPGAGTTVAISVPLFA